MIDIQHKGITTSCWCCEELCQVVVVFKDFHDMFSLLSAHPPIMVGEECVNQCRSGDIREALPLYQCFPDD